MRGALPRKKIRDEVAERIKQFIVAGHLAPGDKLPNESELAESFGVSRLSVREATKALEFLGIVESKTGVGLAVGQIDLSRMTDHLGFHPALHSVDPLELIDSRVIIETGVLPHVAMRMAANPEIHKTLQAIVDEFGAARDLSTFIELDIKFHRALLEASGLSPLIAFGDLLQVFFQRFRDSIRRAEWKQGMETHQHILDLLRKQETQSAIAELRTHIESHKARIKSK